MEGLLPLKRHVLVTSSRASFELVQKAAMAGMPMLVAVSAPSSLAVELAKESGMTLVGFTRGHRCVIYAGEDRIVPTEPQTSVTSRIRTARQDLNTKVDSVDPLAQNAL